MNGRTYPGPDPRKILIIKPSAFGDIIHGLPVLHALHLRYPDARIHWVVARGLHGILEDHPLIERLWVFDKNAWKKPRNLFGTFAELRALAANLRAEKFDLVVDLQGLLRSAAIGLFSGTRDRVGFENAREGAKYSYGYRVKTPSELHAVDKNMLVARFLRCGDAEPVFSMPPLGPPPAVLRQLPRYAVLAPSAGTLVKRWPEESFARLASLLPIPSAVVGGTSDIELGERIARLSGGRAINLAGRTTLKELAALIGSARFMVCADTGPMHVAAALQVPVFAVFGPTNPARTGPYGKIHTIIRKDLPCSPCYKRKPCSDRRCMTEITPEEVLRAISKRPGICG